jgi:hypothetical protein
VLAALLAVLPYVLVAFLAIQPDVLAVLPSCPGLVLSTVSALILLCVMYRRTCLKLLIPLAVIYVNR